MRMGMKTVDYGMSHFLRSRPMTSGALPRLDIWFTSQNIHSPKKTGEISAEISTLESNWIGAAYLAICEPIIILSRTTISNQHCHFSNYLPAINSINLVHHSSVLKHQPIPYKHQTHSMALQASLLPSLSIHKEGAKSNGSVKETPFFGVPLTDHMKSEFNPSILRSKRDMRKLAIEVRAQTAATAAPEINRATSETKKTLRKGNVIVTGASSGLGLATAKALADTGKWHIIMACRDFLKAERAAKSAGMSKENYTVMHLDLASLDSVRQFVDNFRRSGMPLDVLVCNAAVYLPTAREPTYTADGFELSVGTNHLGHFLLSRLLLDDLKKSDYPSKRLIIVGSITGNTNTLAGNVPPKANLGDLRGLAGGLNGLNSSTMIDGGDFDGAKAYKDSKVCNMLTMQEFHRRYHEDTGVTFASLYPGCIATTGLFREHIPLFRLLFPPFQKYITKGFVSEEESGKRLAQVVSDPSLTKSGVYWSWNKDSASFENQLSQEASDGDKARKVWEISEKLVGLA